MTGPSAPDPAVEPTCTVGQPRHVCGHPVVYVIAVGVRPDVYSRDEPTRGVAYLCERHAATPPRSWDEPLTPGDER